MPINNARFKSLRGPVGGDGAHKIGIHMKARCLRRSTNPGPVFTALVDSVYGLVLCSVMQSINLTYNWSILTIFLSNVSFGLKNKDNMSIELPNISRNIILKEHSLWA